MPLLVSPRAEVLHDVRSQIENGGGETAMPFGDTKGRCSSADPIIIPLSMKACRYDARKRGDSRMVRGGKMVRYSRCKA